MNIDDMTHFPVLYLIFREKGMKTVFTCSKSTMETPEQ